MKKLMVIIMLVAVAGIARADYELRLNDGAVLRWREYSITGDQYCTRTESGTICLMKSDVVSVREVPAGTDAVAPKNAVSAEPVRRAVQQTVDGIPVTGADTPGVESLDEVMTDAMKRIGCSAAALAIADHGMMVYSRGYGWMDKERKVAMQPHTMIGIASCEKPITAASIRKLARERRLNLKDKLFEFLKIRPRGRVVDDRMLRITINDLLGHTAGWGADPVTAAAEAARRAGFQEPVPSGSKAVLPDPAAHPVFMETFLGFVMTERLQNAPGAKSVYCNFDSDTLRYIITRVTGRPYIEYFQRKLFRPEVVREFKAHDMPRRKSDPPLVWNAETGGLGASAPALLTFMRHYWLTGEPRDAGNPLWIMYGSLPGSTAIMVWRPDGIDLVALFNGRGTVTHDEISRSLQAVIDRLKENRSGGFR